MAYVGLKSASWIRLQMIQRSKALRWISGFKYRTTEPYWLFTNFRPAKSIQLHRIHLTREGLLFIEPGYSSDGPSGPTIDTDDIMPGATAVHDPGYELLRNGMMNVSVDIIQPDQRPGEGIIYKTPEEDRVIKNASHEQIRHEFDKLLADLMLLDGAIVSDRFSRFPRIRKIIARVLIFRAQYFYDGLRLGGVSSAIQCRKEYTAP